MSPCSLRRLDVLEDSFKSAVDVCAQAQSLFGLTSEGHHGKRLFTGENKLYWMANHLCSHWGQQRVNLRLLAAESSIRQRCDHAGLIVELKPADDLTEDAGQTFFQPEPKGLTQDDRIAITKLRKHADGHTAVFFQVATIAPGPWRCDGARRVNFDIDVVSAKALNHPLDGRSLLFLSPYSDLFGIT